MSISAGLATAITSGMSFSMSRSYKNGEIMVASGSRHWRSVCNFRVFVFVDSGRERDEENKIEENDNDGVFRLSDITI